MKSLEVQLDEIVNRDFERFVGEVENAIREEAPLLKTEDPRLKPKVGALKESISKEKKTDKIYLVGVDGDKLKGKTGTDYSPYVVYGTRPHKITAKGKKLKFYVGNNIVYKKSVNHPGSRPNDFISKAVKKFK